MTTTSHLRNGTRRDGHERRRDHRIPDRLPIAAILDGREVRILCSNVSIGGACCRCESRIPPMTRLDVALELPPENGRTEPEKLHLHAVVLRCEPDSEEEGRWKLALFFLEPEPTALDRLSRYVHAHPASPPA